MPVVIYWNPHYWEIKKSAKVYFDKLKKAGVFHDSPESAARHVNLIWHDVKSWWDNKDVKDAVKSFKDNYCHKPTNLVDKLHSTIEKAFINCKKNHNG
jgi:putative transferase (TIGR04331 family)